MVLALGRVAHAEDFDFYFNTTSGDQGYGNIHGLASSGSSIPISINGYVVGPDVYGYQSNPATSFSIDDLFTSPPGTSYGSASGSFTVNDGKITAADFRGGTQHTGNFAFFGVDTTDGGSFFLSTPQHSYGGAATLQFEDPSIPMSPTMTSAAPEPGVWVLMLTGIGLAGFALRRRHRGVPGVNAVIA